MCSGRTLLTGGSLTYINRYSLLVVDTLSDGEVLGNQGVVLASKDEDAPEALVRLDDGSGTASHAEAATTTAAEAAATTAGVLEAATASASSAEATSITAAATAESSTAATVATAATEATTTTSVSAEASSTSSEHFRLSNICICTINYRLSLTLIFY